MRLGGMKYLSPMRYMGIKLLANAIYASIAPRRPRPLPRVFDLTRKRAVVAPSTHLCYPAPVPTKSFPAPQRLRPEAVIRVKSLAESRPVFNHAPHRPAAVKANGGLRGSTATKWR